MIGLHEVILMIVTFLCGLALGWIFGRFEAIYSLLIGAQGRDRTPHKLAGRFYYVVPESEYCRMSTAELREAARHEEGPARIRE